nr:glycoside hydrolase family 3 N-terminal domain-containing protein [uncultured Microbacterium sp.]
MTSPDHAHSDSKARGIVDSLSLEQQVGLLLHPMIVLDADPDASSGFGAPSMRELIVDHGIRFFCLGPIPDPVATARIIDDLQQVARNAGSPLPLVFSTDPRHAFMQNDGAAHRASGVSAWPENLGLGAIGDIELVRRHAEVVRQDYVAMGIRMALHPQVDLTTEPRWGRQAQSFGADPEKTSRLLEAFLQGLQGDRVGANSVAATVKHFPGGGPQLDGEDPHFPYGREQVYPAGRFDDHLEPFRAAIDAGAAAIMPYYGMPVDLVIDGEAIEPVGFAFNRQIITGLLRERLGFEGVVLSDFGLVTDIEIGGKPFPARAWGVEHLSELHRVARLFEAGVDQLGGERDAELILGALRQGLISPERVRESALRIVRLMTRLHAEPREASVSASDLPLPGDVDLGEAAQARAITVLTNGPLPLHPLPMTGALRVHLANLAPLELPDGWRESEVGDADIAIMRLAAPYEHRDDFFLESGMQQGSLEFGADVIEEILNLAERVPLVLVITLNRPAILTPFVDSVAAIVADFGASDDVVVRVLSGQVAAEGRLPFEIPRSMAAVVVSAPDAADDTEDPLFPAGWRVEPVDRTVTA